MTEKGNTIRMNHISENSGAECNESKLTETAIEACSTKDVAGEKHSGNLCEEIKSDKIQQTSEIDSKNMKNENNFRRSFPTGFVFVTLSVFAVFLIAAACLVLVFRFRRDTLDILSDIKKSHEKLKSEATKSMMTAFKSFQKRLNEVQTREEQLMQNLSKIQFQINKMRIQDLSYITNLTFLENQIHELRRERKMDVSKIAEELHTQKIEWIQNLSTVRSQVNEIRIQDLRQFTNFTAVQNQIRDVQRRTNTNVSTITDDVRRRKVEWKQNLSRIISEINEIHIQDLRQITNLTSMRNQIHEIQAESNRRVSAVKFEIDQNQNQLLRLNNSLLLQQIQLDEIIAKANRRFSIAETEFQESREQKLALNASLFALRTQVTGTLMQEKEMKSNISTIMKNLINLEKLNKTLEFIDSRIEAIKDSELKSFFGINRNHEQDHNLSSIIILNRLNNESRSLKESLRILRTGVDEYDREIANLKKILLRNATIVLLGGNESAGRVEILHDGEWGTICDDHWDMEDATVVCRMLGYSRATSAPHSASYGQGVGKIWLDDVRCNGTEHRLMNCTKRDWGSHNCGHSEDASVACSI